MIEQTQVRGLDTVRFVLAPFVVFGHLAFFPLLKGIDRSWLPGLILCNVYSCPVAGPPAVIVFFVISGFCVQFPQRSLRAVKLVPFCVRRFARILIPLAAALLIVRNLGMQLAILNDSILWSLVCEELYYAIYPALLVAMNRFGLRILIVVAYVLSYLLAMTNPHAGIDPSFGPGMNWILGLPCWLLGCSLAGEWDGTLRDQTAGTLPHLWSWRMSALIGSMICTMLRFHGPVGYPWTLNLFAIPAVCWLRAEIITAQRARPPCLEPRGAFSYSIYLMHFHAFRIWTQARFHSLGYILDWVLMNLFSLGFCYAFYWFVERPFHGVARLLGRLARGGLPSMRTVVILAGSLSPAARTQA